MLTHLIPLATLALLFAPATNPPPPTDEPVLHQIEKNVVHRTNAERERVGLAPLKIDRELVESARKHGAWMTHTGNLVHTTAQVAENIAMGQRTSAEVVRDWMNSPGHRANMLNASYTRVGVAAYTASDGTVFWCLQFLS